MEPIQQLDPIVDRLTTLVDGTRLDQLDNRTPCDEWAVRDLLNHLCGGAHMFAAAFRGETLDMPDDGSAPDLIGSDPQTAWKTAIEDFRTSLARPGALDQTVPLPFGDMPAEFALQLAACDILVHGWDLAQGTDQPFDPPAELVAGPDAFARVAISDDLRTPGIFGPEQPAPDGATPIDALAAFAGRRVS